jgi:hypothetical protein
MTETDGTTSGPKRVRLSAGYVEALEALTGYGADLLNALNGDNEYCCSPACDGPDEPCCHRWNIYGDGQICDECYEVRD